MRQGTLRADGIAVSAVSYDLVTRRLSVVGAYVNTQDGTTLGMIPERALVPSERARQALEELVDALEEDLSLVYLEGSSVVEGRRRAPSRGAVDPSAPRGIGESLGVVDDAADPTNTASI